ncbi:thrombospondin type 3 repeat-containing protein [Shewanella sp.]|uniref:PKD domain-containing protein n=1 Tax=Shewanella sp. TaxID=50422 RepID=UPI00258DFFD9|nr:thrombospondin type 3 repeat-containing protein [Shewanella sp.]MCJ8302624.1 hypothetical protein [Shewanella sp.]
MLTLPNGKIVTGIVKRTIEGRVSLNGDDKAPLQIGAYTDSQENESSVDSMTVISFQDRAGALTIIERHNKIVAMQLHDVSKGEIYRSEFDEYGRGEFIKQDINQYLCADYPEPPSYGLEEIEARLPEHIPSLIDLHQLQSKPSSPRTLYLNNWGGRLSGTIWNNNYNSGNDIDYTAYSYDADTANFSDLEKKIMWLVWREVAEDYAIFDINVTTSQAVFDATPVGQRSQIIATTTRDFYPRAAGGVAYVGIFGNGSDYMSAGFNWVRSIDMGMAHAHESGHQMGLGHDGTSSFGYYSGHGQWGPIMGAPYGKDYVQWSRGDYADANQHQDDIAIITRVLGVVADDAGDFIIAPTPLPFPSREYLGQIAPGGVANDIDVYEFTVASAKTVNITVESALLAESEFQGANLAFNVVLTDGAGVPIASSASSDFFPLSTSSNRFQYIGPLEADTYFLIIDGVSPDTGPATGFVEYGNGGQYVLTIEDPNALSDVDGDGIADAVDNCPMVSNPLQVNTDGSFDGGDACDLDDDNDGYSDVVEQAEGSDPLDPLDKPDDLDNDFIPDSSDNDIDGDGVNNTDDAFPRDADETTDTDNDGIGNNADPDDDNDGIIDERDAEPFNPSVGDDLPPVFGDIKALTIEATANKTALVLVEPEVTDNNIYPLTLSSDYAAPLSVGTHNILWTAIDHAGNRAVKTQVIHIVDTSAPVIDDAAVETIDASGITTDISTKITTYAIDIVDGDIPLTVETPRLKSGQHRVAVSAKDSSGNLAEGYLNIKLNPQVSLPSEELLVSASHYQLQLVLSGVAAVYPVVVEYQIAGAIDGATAGEVRFESGIKLYIDINISRQARDGDEVTIRLTRADNAVIANDKLVLTVSKQNFAPQVDLVMQQAGKNTQVIDPSLGLVTVLAQVKDKNSEDIHQISWQANNSSIRDLNLDGLVSSFEFDPKNLPQEVFSLQVTVDDNNSLGPLTAWAQQDLVIHKQNGNLSSDTDSDNDGVSDQDEGYGDNDLDGIADYLDVEMDRSRLPIADNTAPLQTLPNLSLSLGYVVLSSCGFDCRYSALTEVNIAEHGSERGLAVENSLDSDFTAASHTVNYRISNLGDSELAAIVIPLENSQSIPEKARYRLFSPSGSWGEFRLDANNSISSAKADRDGNCPVALSELYVEGLNKGDNCIQLIIEDGGINDQDHRLNGVITSVGKMAVEVINQVVSLSIQTDKSSYSGGQSILVSAEVEGFDNDTLSYLWQQTSGKRLTIADPSAPSLKLTAPRVSSNEKIMLKLTVTDGSNTLTESIQLVVNKTLATTTSGETTGDDSGGSLSWYLVLTGLLLVRRRLI